MTARIPFAGRLCLAIGCVLLLLSATACGSAQQATASSPQVSPLEYVGEWGMRGDGPGELDDPVGMAVDLNNRVYFADRRLGRLQKFEDTGVPLFSDGNSAARTGTALTVDSGGAIYIADARGGRVWIHFPDGDLLRNFRIAPQRAGDPSFAFAVTGDGTVVVPDPDGGRVQAFASSGRLESIWKLPPGPAGQAARPFAVAAGLDEFIYVAEAATGRIFKYTQAGAQVAVWEPPADAALPLRGIGVSRGHVFALRGATPQLEVWTFDGQRVLTDALGNRFASAPSSLSLAVSRDEQVFIFDPAKPRVFRFRLHLPSQ